MGLYSRVCSVLVGRNQDYIMKIGPQQPVWSNKRLKCLSSLCEDGENLFRFSWSSVKQLRRVLNVWQIKSVRMPFSVILLVKRRTAVFESIKRKTYDEAAKLPCLANCVIRLCFHSLSSHSSIFHQQLWYFVISKVTSKGSEEKMHGREPTWSIICKLVNIGKYFYWLLNDINTVKIWVLTVLSKSRYACKMS